MAKTWDQKYHNGREPFVEVIDKPFAGMIPGDKMLISSPKEVESELRKIPKGTVCSLQDFRTRLAQLHNAAGTCPMTTSIFLRIVTERALELTPQDLPPFWRVIDPKSPLASKLSCGQQFIVDQRLAESN